MQAPGSDSPPKSAGKKHPNIDFPLPVDDYPMSEFESKSKMITEADRSGKYGEPISVNPDHTAPAPNPETFGMGRGPDGAN
jgi:hypothetical protein